MDIGRAERPLRILFSGNALFAGTGYGAQAAQVIPRLCALGHDVAHFAWYGLQGASLNYGVSHQGKSYGLLIYPGIGDGYGNNAVAAYAQHHKADVVISLIDAWVLDPEAHGGARRWAPWFPIDSDPIPLPVLSKVKDALCPIVYSRFGERMARNAGLDVAYVPHAVETDVFCPGDDRAATRQRLGIPQDAWVALVVAANKDNPSRKAWPQMLEAWAEFVRRHPDAVLYAHTIIEGGTDLGEIIDRLGIGRSIIAANQFAIASGAHDSAYMAALYRAADVLLSPSLGEGFGVPLLEAQACGTPVIAGRWTAMEELIFGGYGIGKGDAERWPTPQGSYWWLPRVGAITEALDWAYTHAARYHDAARAGALAYDADVVARDYWRPVLDSVAERIGVGEEVPA